MTNDYKKEKPEKRKEKKNIMTCKVNMATELGRWWSAGSSLLPRERSMCV